MLNSIIEVKNLFHSYMTATPFEKEILHNLSFDIYEGEKLAIIGPTQSGKSTLLQYFNAIFIPKKGRVIVDGRDTRDSKLNLKELRRKVAMLFQHPDSQLFKDIVADDIAFGLKNFNFPEEVINITIKKALATVGLEPDEFFYRYIFSLSGGEKRKVAIAGVLALNPEILILDDPTAGLDPKGRRDLINSIRFLHNKLELTTIFVSSNMDDVLELADRIVVLFDGEIKMIDTPKNIFKQKEKLLNYGLTLPSVVEVVDELIKSKINISEKIIGIDQLEESLIKLFKK